MALSRISPRVRVRVSVSIVYRIATGAIPGYGANSYDCLVVVICRENGDHIRHGGGIEEGAQSDSKHSQASSVTEKRGKSLSVGCSVANC